MHEYFSLKTLDLLLLASRFVGPWPSVILRARAYVLLAQIPREGTIDLRRKIEVYTQARKTDHTREEAYIAAKSLYDDMLVFGKKFVAIEGPNVRRALIEQIEKLV